MNKKKILQLDKLILLFKKKYSLSKVVLVTGCFDILHRAHKEFLKAAGDQGDILVVGIEHDERVRKLKGKDRPVNSWQVRAWNLAKLSSVDFVSLLPVNFGSSKSHFKLLRDLRPRILAVSENTPHLKKKKHLIKKVGGKLYIFLYNSDYSTSKIVGLAK